MHKQVIYSILTIAVLFISQYCHVEAIRFELQANTKKCLKEEMRKDLLVVGEYDISALPGTTIDFQILDSKGHTALIRDNINEPGKFAVTSDKDDEYEFCFSYSSSPNTAHHLAPREVFLNVKVGIEARSYEAGPNDDKMTELDQSLTRTQDVTNSIIDDLAYLKKRESEMRDTNESTSRRVFYQSIISVIILIVLATWQILYLRRFFKARKLID